MHLIYVDEAGNTGKKLDDPQQPYHVVLALLVPVPVWRDVEAAMAAIVAEHVPEQDRPTFEFHGFELHQGKGYFRGWKGAVRLGIGKQVLGILDRFDLHVIYGACDKRGLERRYGYPMHPHDLGFLLAAERCERYLASLGADELGMFIADRNMEIEGQIRTSLRHYRSEGIRLGMVQQRLDHIIEDIHFQASQASYFLQIADFCAYYVKRSLVKQEWSDPRAQMVQAHIGDSRILP